MDDEITLPENWRDLAISFANRRMNLCRRAPACPRCGTKQVQLINPLALARWKCRHCKTKWTYEPVFTNGELTGEGKQCLPESSEQSERG